MGMRLRGLSRKVDNVYRKHLEGTGLTENQLSILMALFKTGKTEQTEIARILNLERSSLSRSLTRLIDQGFILKQGVINRPVISLTKKGNQKITRVLPLWERAMEEVLGQLTGKDLVCFRNFEEKLNK